MSKNILLMTATIKPFCNVTYNNAETRYMEYINNIEKYIKSNLFDVVIFAENSGYPFDERIFTDMASEQKVIFEYLDLSNETMKTGNMSVGDAQLIKLALDRSKYINDEKSIWKVSGRIYINNINRIITLTKNKENVFLYSHKYDAMQTWFFKANIDSLKKYFLTDRVIKRMEYSCIEYIFRDVWWENHTKIKINRFPCYPNSVGLNSSGNPYTMKRSIFFVKNIFLKMGYFTVKNNGKRNKNT